MNATTPVFALNHMSAPRFDIGRFFALAASLGVGGVEIRNDLDGNAILDGTPPEEVRSLAARHGLEILSINALQRFNEWNGARESEARSLASYCARCGARGLVLVPVNDGSGRADGERQANLRVALQGLAPILVEAGILGLVEPLGFATCSLRLKSEAVEAIEAAGMTATFRLVHDTFHHFVAGESVLFPQITGLVHVSGVADRSVTVTGMRDAHRVLVDGEDRIGNVEQIAALIDGGYAGPLSFEPFAPAVHALADPGPALSASIAHLRSALV
ncbi:MAG: hypothetical protein BroJett030_12280 [Alphaproteobacteria bacterium]|nr:MAG: hypothetical protein BroJett030_12280 [Alphaproteobacteria bacterium]